MTAHNSSPRRPPMRRSQLQAPRVLLLEGHLRDNGGLRVSEALAKRWQSSGARVRILILETANDGPLRSLDPTLDVRFGSTKEGRFRTNAGRILATVVREARHADVIVSGSEVGYGVLFGLVAARLTGRPLVVLIQAMLPLAVSAWHPASLRRVLLWAHRHIDAAICVSPGLVPAVIANGLVPPRVHTARIGIDVDDVVRQAVGPGLPRTPDSLQVVAMGRMVREKGFDILLQAMGRVRRAGVQLELNLIGDGPERQALEQQARDEGIAHVVQFLGHQAHPQPLLASADLFVLSSRTEGNGSLVLLEALAHNIPVIAADCPTGPRYVLSDGTWGGLVAPDDPAAMASALFAFAADPSSLREIGAHGRARAYEFDAALGAQDALDVVDGLAHRRMK